MFWTKKTKINEKVEEQAPSIPVETYNLADEVAIHAMPSRYKDMHVEGQQAKKVGMLILGGGVFVFLLVVAGIAWVFLGTPANTAKTVVTQPIEQGVVATTTEVVSESISELAKAGDVIATTSDIINATSTAIATTSTATSTEVVDATTTPPVISSADSDGDGLLDQEEDLLGSNRSSKDSDGDTYADLVEVLKGYNPTGAGKLIDDQAIAQYSNNLYGLIYPRSWPFKIEDADTVIFTTPENQMLIVNINDNSTGLDLATWYKSEFKVENISANNNLSQLDAKGTVLWAGIRSDDGLTYYLMDSNKKKIVAISYNLGPSNTVLYDNIIKTLVNSFRFK